MKSLEDYGPLSFIWTAASQISPNWAWSIWNDINSMCPASFYLQVLFPHPPRSWVVFFLTQRFWQPCFQLAFSQQLDLHLTLSLVTAWTSQSTHFSLPYSNSLGFYLPATFIHSPGGTGCFFPAWNLSAMHCSFSLETVRGPYISLC